MKRLLILVLISCLGCAGGNEDKEKTVPSPKNIVKDSIGAATVKIPEKAFMCFFSINNEDQSKNLRDSIILDLELTGEVATGIFNWIPAEKDSRRGVIQATKNGDEVKGNYTFMQEGVQDTISIEIQIQGTSAMITTISESGEEMNFQVERVDCQ